MEASVLKKIPFFSDLPNDEIRLLAGVAGIKRYPKDALVVKEGDRTSSLYLVVEGMLKVLRNGKNGKEVIFSILRPGDIFGEMSFLDDRPRSANVCTVTACDLVAIGKQDFNACMEKNRRFMHKVVKTLIKRLASADKMIERLALETVYERVVHLLYDQAEDGPRSGKKVIRGAMTQMEMAAVVGASREMVSKVMKELVEGEYLLKNGRDIVINKRLPEAW